MITVILGVKTDNRSETALRIQRVLTKFGCFIRTRLGLHSQRAVDCTEYGLLLIEITDKEKSVDIEQMLLDIDGVEIQRMEFCFS